MLRENSHGGQDAQCHGQVKPGTLLFDAGRCQIDGDAIVGELVTGIADGGLDALFALLDRRLGQPHGGKRGQAGLDIHFHFD